MAGNALCPRTRADDRPAMLADHGFTLHDTEWSEGERYWILAVAVRKGLGYSDPRRLAAASP